MFQELLQKLFRLFDEDRDSLLVQEDWVDLLKERLT
jgi:Ca2+-binding EF-hand superfamily protein